MGQYLHGERVVVRTFTSEDLPAVAGILRGPAVVRWWGEYDADRFAEDLGDDDIHPFVVQHLGAIVGYIQYWEESDPQYRHASMDIALGDADQGLGLGSDAVRTLCRYLLLQVGHHRLTIDPAAGNERAIRCYQRVGFRRVGLMRQYERGPDGTWHDGLLMDLLAAELT